MIPAQLASTLPKSRKPMLQPKPVCRQGRELAKPLGLIMIVIIYAANIPDSIGAKEVLLSLKDKYLTGIKKIFADGGYLGELS